MSNVSDSEHLEQTSAAKGTAHPTIPSALWGHALAGGLLVMAGYVVAYLIQFDWLLGNWSTPYVLMVVVAVMVMVLLTVRREEGGLAFGRAFGLAFLAGWLARIGYNLFLLVFFQILRPDLVDAYADLVLGKSMEAFSAFGLDGGMPAEIEGMSMEDLVRDQAVWSISPGGQVVDALTGMLWVAIVALVVAAILRRTAESDGFKG
ncbi:MAG: DUF4199 family protein [Crocinitomicaceae bacterium TMED114]|nr:MAG: DUF4199 family protein [Crocinitomicaceae bacterium TMED114]|tara:strand:+ start:768 stop:1382 length:615 start_codon:yes stop_codon:yes gene_type:complete